MLPVKTLAAIQFLFSSYFSVLPFQTYQPGSAAVTFSTSYTIPGDAVDLATLPAPGVNIYKDKNTVSLEKMVTPWLLYYTNLYRKEHGLDTLKYDDCLLKAAGYHSEYLFNQSKETNQFRLVHQQDPGSKWFKGKSPSDRALTAGCQKYCGENALYISLPNVQPEDFLNMARLNLAAKKIAKDMVFEYWNNSKAHRENMLTKGYTCLGVSVAIGKHQLQNAYVDDKSLVATPGKNNTVSMIAFGVQVLAF